MDDDDEDITLMPIPRGDGGGSSSSSKAASRWYGNVSEARWEALRGVVVRLYYSRLTAIVYMVTLMLGAALLSVTLGMDTPLRDAPGALLFLEGCITFSLILEVVLRAIVLGSDYLKSWSNILDSVIAVACVSLFFFASPRASKSKDFETQKEDVELSQSLVMARTMVQFGRLLLIAKNANRSRQASSTDDITFAKLVGGEDDLDFDFSVLQERQLQAKHRAEDFGL